MPCGIIPRDAAGAADGAVSRAWYAWLQLGLLSFLVRWLPPNRRSELFWLPSLPCAPWHLWDNQDLKVGTHRQQSWLFLPHTTSIRPS